MIQPLLETRAKNVKIFVGFLGYEKTRLFAFEILTFDTYRVAHKYLNDFLKNGCGIQMSQAMPTTFFILLKHI